MELTKTTSFISPAIRLTVISIWNSQQALFENGGQNDSGEEGGHVGVLIVAVGPRMPAQRVSTLAYIVDWAILCVGLVAQSVLALGLWGAGLGETPSFLCLWQGKHCSKRFDCRNET